MARQHGRSTGNGWYGLPDRLDRQLSSCVSSAPRTPRRRRTRRRGAAVFRGGNSLRSPSIVSWKIRCGPLDVLHPVLAEVTQSRAPEGRSSSTNSRVAFAEAGPGRRGRRPEIRAARWSDRSVVTLGVDRRLARVDPHPGPRTSAPAGHGCATSARCAAAAAATHVERPSQNTTKNASPSVPPSCPPACSNAARRRR